MCGYYYSHLHKKVNIPFLIDFLKQKDIQFSCKIKNYKNMTEKIAKIDRIKLSGFNVNHLPPPYGKPPKNSHISTTILSIHGVIKKITGLRAGVINDLRPKKYTILWPLENKKADQSILVIDNEVIFGVQKVKEIYSHIEKDEIDFYYLDSRYKNQHNKK
jgi:hypothetical protein